MCPYVDGYPPERCPSKRVVRIACVRKFMHLKSLGLIDYHDKIEFLPFNLRSSLFLTNLIALYVYK